MEEFLLCSFIEFTLLYGWSPVNLLGFCKTPFLNNIYGRLLLDVYTVTRNKANNVLSTNTFVLLPTVSRTTLYTLSSHFITCKKFLLQAYFLQISLKLTWANNSWQWWKNCNETIKQPLLYYGNTMVENAIVIFVI